MDGWLPPLLLFFQFSVRGVDSGSLLLRLGCLRLLLDENFQLLKRIHQLLMILAFLLIQRIYCPKTRISHSLGLVLRSNLGGAEARVSLFSGSLHYWDIIEIWWQQVAILGRVVMDSLTFRSLLLYTELLVVIDSKFLQMLLSALR